MRLIPIYKLLYTFLSEDPFPMVSIQYDKIIIEIVEKVEDFTATLVTRAILCDTKERNAMLLSLAADESTLAHL